ncbi:MAG: DUF4437 domain-containing protein [Actinomycetota bacterium]
MRTWKWQTRKPRQPTPNWSTGHRAAVREEKITNPIDEEMRQMVANSNEMETVASAAALSAGVAKGKQWITVPTADLEDMHSGSPVKFAVLWGDHKKGPFGMLLKQPGGGFEAGMHAHASDYHGVLVQGIWIHTVEGDSSALKELTPGSYVFQPAWQFRNDKFLGAEGRIVYIQQLGKADFIEMPSHALGVQSEDKQGGD